MVRLDSPPPHSAESANVQTGWPDGMVPPPTELYSDEPPLETDLHREQIDLLIRLLKYWWRERNDFYVSGNLTVYYSAEQIKTRDFKGPDVFVVLGTEKRDRRSWTVWEEQGKYPNLVIELLSNSTATVDRGSKKQLYQDIWRLPEYFWFHPETLEFEGFRLVKGQYEAIASNPDGRLKSEELDLELGIYDETLRWFTNEGKLIPLPEEIERQAREKLENYLRSQGIDPEQLPD